MKVRSEVLALVVVLVVLLVIILVAGARKCPVLRGSPSPIAVDSQSRVLTQSRKRNSRKRHSRHHKHHSNSSSSSSDSCESSCRGALNSEFGINGVKTIRSVSNNLIQADRLVVQYPGVNVLMNGNYLLQIDDSGNLLTDGFGTAGLVDMSVVVSSNFYAQQLCIQMDGKILVCGLDSVRGTTVARFHRDGTLDSSFNGSGILTHLMSADPTDDSPNGIIITRKGRIVVCGSVDIGGDYQGFVWCLNPSGGFSNHFNHTGIYYFGMPLESTFYAVVEQCDGKLLLAGYYESDPLLIRLKRNGSLDGTFGVSGIAQAVTGINDYAYFSCLTIQEDGRIICAGQADDQTLIVEYTYNGRVDTNFGTGGSIKVAYTGSGSSYTAIRNMCDGSIVLTGYGYQNTLTFITAKYDSRGHLVTSFGNNGSVEVVSTLPIRGDSMIQLRDGSLLYLAYSQLINLSCE